MTIYYDNYGVKDLLKELIMIGAKEKKEIHCASIKEAIDWRQKLYGKKKQMLKPDNRDLTERKAAENFETKITDKNGDVVRFAGKEFKANLAAGLYEPCTIAVQPRGLDLRKTLEQVLAQEIASGTLPSQVKEKEYLESVKHSTLGMVASNPGATSDNVSSPFAPIAPASPFDAMRKAGLITDTSGKTGSEAQSSASASGNEPESLTSKDLPDLSQQLSDKSDN